MATLTGYRPSHPHSSSTHTSHSDSLRQSTLKKNMSITQTYYLAHKARAKLSREAAQPDHDLRLLVGHANLLDSLMLELAEAEREQERWFNQSVRDAKVQQQQQNKDRHIQWADSIVEEDEYDSDSSSDSDDSLDEDDVEMVNAPALMHPVSVSAKQIDEDMGEDDLEDDYAHLELVRTPSHAGSPPELVDPDSESSDDESAMPPSPPQPNLGFSEQEVRQQSEEDADDESDQEETKPFYKDGFYLPPRSPARLVSAITVY